MLRQADEQRTAVPIVEHVWVAIRALLGVADPARGRPCVAEREMCQPAVQGIAGKIARARAAALAARPRETAPRPRDSGRPCTNPSLPPMANGNRPRTAMKPAAKSNAFRSIGRGRVQLLSNDFTKGLWAISGASHFGRCPCNERGTLRARSRAQARATPAWRTAASPQTGVPALC